MNLSLNNQRKAPLRYIRKKNQTNFRNRKGWIIIFSVNTFLLSGISRQPGVDM